MAKNGKKNVGKKSSWTITEKEDIPLSEKSNETIMNYVPLWITPRDALAGLPWAINDFTFVEEISNTYQAALKEYNESKGISWDLTPRPTIALKLFPSTHDKSAFDTTPVNFGLNRCKAFLLALFLAQPVSFAITRIYVVDLLKDSTPHFTGWDRSLQCQAKWVASEKYHDEINPEEMSKLFGLMQEYFQFDEIRVDRISVALNALWASLNTEDWRQAYISRTVILEAILSTDKEEITHKMAERTVLLLDKEGLLDDEGWKPLDTYRNFKKLYGIRSDIVHGRFVKKRPIIAFAQGSSLNELHELTNMSRLILRHAILNDELRKKLQDTSEKRLREYFEKLQFEPKEEDKGK